MCIWLEMWQGTVIDWCGLNLLTQRIVASDDSIRSWKRTTVIEWMIVCVQLFGHCPQRILALGRRCRRRCVGLVLFPIRPINIKEKRIKKSVQLDHYDEMDSLQWLTFYG